MSQFFFRSRSQFDATKLRDFMEFQSHQQKDSLEQQNQSMPYDKSRVAKRYLKQSE
ncbi:hypothetical protein [Marinomonas alcarazii]|uniref:hypothetical protein n=1 Tax=Marinomonas alcarazii TaxID=491949 RepID=UPI0015E87E37|nr:hypothetical protein [Marinomonas alcarazii]